MKKYKILLLLQKYLPPFLWNIGAGLNKKYLRYKYLKGDRPLVQGETSKANGRRIREGFFEKYCKGKGLDIGYGGDLLVPDADGWDFEHGDAQFLNSIKDNTYDFVYSSHTLEHIDDAGEALVNWYRVVKPGGFLILYIPHRDLYEKKEKLPSRFNQNHKRFFLPVQEYLPDTIGIIPFIQRTLSGYEIVYCKECNEGHTIQDSEIHSNGEYSIEVIIKKSIMK
jgi:SAM-dependent methyltransferase